MVRALLVLSAAAVLTTGAARGACLVDDFSTDPFASRWYRSHSSITWDSANQEIDFSGASGVYPWAVYKTPLSETTEQWMQIKMTGSLGEVRAFLRKDAVTTDNNYYDLKSTKGNYAGNAYDQIVNVRGGSAWRLSRMWGQVPDTDWIGFQVTGTGETGTRFKFWACGVAPCGGVDWDDPSKWGTPDWDYSRGTGWVNAPIDSGPYIGIRFGGGPGAYSFQEVRGGGVNCNAGGGGSPPRRVILVTKALERIVPAQMEDLTWFVTSPW